MRAKPVSHDDYDDDTDFDLMIHSRGSDNEIIPFRRNPPNGDRRPFQLLGIACLLQSSTTPTPTRKGNRKEVVNWEVCTTLGSLYDSYAYVAVAEQDV